MAAAEHDPNRQSLLSRQVKELESTLEVELMDRTSSPAVPTELAQRLSQLFTAFEAGVQNEIENHAATRTVRIGAGESIIQWLLIPLLTKKNTQQHRYEFHNLRSAETLKKLKSGQLDIGVITRPCTDSSFESVHLSTLKMKLIGQKESFPRKLKCWGDLAEVKVACLHGADLACNAEFKCTSYAQLIELALRPGVLSVVSEICTQTARRQGLKSAYFPPLAGAEVQLHLVWRKSSASPWLQGVIDSLCGAGR